MDVDFDTDDAVAFQARVNGVRNAPDPVQALCELFHEARNKPGVFLIADGEAKTKGDRVLVRPTFRVTPFHHLDTTSLGNRVIGLTSLKVDSTLGAIATATLTTGLVSDKKANSKTWKEKCVPSLETLAEEKHPINKPVRQQEGKSVFSISDLVEWPRLTFLPIQLMAMMFERMQLVGEDEDDTEVDESNPEQLLERLIQGWRTIKEKEPQFLEEFKELTTYPATFLWTISNHLNNGVELMPVEVDRGTIQHGIQCQQELLWDEEEWKVLGRGKKVENEKRKSSDRENPEATEAGNEKSPRPPPKQSTNLPQEERNRGARAQEQKEPSEDIGTTRALATSRDSDWSEAFVRGFTAANQALADAGKSLNHLAQSSQATLEKKESKDKATSKWLPAWVYLLRALSADQGWQTKGFPATTDAFDQLNEMKLFQATMLVRSAARQQKWPGGMLKSGIADFLKRGLLADDIDVEPSGFSVLFFYGGSYVEKDGEAFNRQQLRESYGDEGLSDEMLRAFNKREIFVPKSTYEAIDQIQSAIAFLNWVLGDENIAVAGYKLGLEILQDHKKVFEVEVSRNKLFLVNYLYMLDRTFQDFCLRMLDFEWEAQPAQAAKARGVHLIMERNIIEVMKPWMVNRIVPQFSAPIKLQGKAASDGVVDLVGGGPGRSGEARSKQYGKNGDTGKADSGKLAQQELVKEWQLPQGKEFADFFGIDHPGNLSGLPKFKHHRTGRMERLCLRYQQASCLRGIHCKTAHIRPSEMSRKDKDTITSHLQEVFKRGQN